MGSSSTTEIEIVPDSIKQNHNPNLTTENEQVPKNPQIVVISDIYTASVYGDLEKLRKFVQDGASLSIPDPNGYYVLQWAALNNFPHLHGGDVNAEDNGMQTALHWAAVRGSTAVADLLLQNGARVEAADVNGYRAVHVAAQYGQTAFLNHIIARYNADFDAPDNDGRSPLHWAAYKGFADTIRLLLFRDAIQGRQDKEGCTPLHWAVIRGHIESSNVLVHAGTKEELVVKDRAGFTPVQLALDKGHRQIALLLSNAQRAHNKQLKGTFCSGKMIGGYAPFLFCTVFSLMIVFINSVLLAPNLLKVTAVVALWGWIAVSLCVGALIMFYRCSSKDPGYIQRSVKSRESTEVEDPLLNIDANNTSVWTGNWSQLCPTCKALKTFDVLKLADNARSDDRSIYIGKDNVREQRVIYNRVLSSFGLTMFVLVQKNKWDFFVFLCLGFATSTISGIVAFLRIWMVEPPMSSGETWMHYIATQYPGFIVFLILDFVIFTASTTLAVSQASQIARNITTNELANASRYTYLRGPEGRFRNPYNHGWRKNCADFLIQGHTADTEIAWLPLRHVSH
ncbi:hypothetical protein KSS87_017599 [Heliosperma pusillum]|nr:hypothetical protein KSS87_017599 [Heliosperma pusillum]